MKIGVLALQGDFAMHARWIERGGVDSAEIRGPRDWEWFDGLIIPGGESTTMLGLIEEEALAAPIMELHRCGKPILGTCAGAILLAREVTNPSQPSLNLIDIKVERNGYGRQVDSFIDKVEMDGGSEIEGVFIRAPKIVDVGPGARVLASHRGEPVLVRQGNVLAATFHPELGTGDEIRGIFLGMTGSEKASEAPPAG
jgi:5'-phosphate synthase pdxT subunit